MGKLKIPKFASKKEELKFLSKNRDNLIAQKKSIFKKADGFAFVGIPHPENSNKLLTNKAQGIPEDATALKGNLVINTTNLFDSHHDVHFNGIWDKTVSENKMIMHVQEHKRNQFDKIISEGVDLKAMVNTYSWPELGFPQFTGKTQALEFESIIRKSRNEFMFDQYRKGYVKNHSVGMIYMKLFLAIGNKEWANAEEFELWEEYLPKIVNQEDVIRNEYFWGVLEAKAIEGSAVPLGSNFITPTLSVEAVKALQDQQTRAAKALEAHKKFLLNL